ncbi:MAG: hypothetical protein Q9220_001602 [cf. Caloplaca sp. 1 TL-2023]
MSRRNSRRGSSTPASGRSHRRPTVYDAVAGRISSAGFIPPTASASKHRDTISSHHVPLPPQEVLFRGRNAPERYEEDDIYWANEKLRDDQEIPESDLLNVIHEYASDFYKAIGDIGRVDFKSMDETALMAMGILLEEAAASVLGETGDLALVEGKAWDTDDNDDVMENEVSPSQASRQGEGQVGKRAEELDVEKERFDESEHFENEQRRKRRKVSSEDGSSDSSI